MSAGVDTHADDSSWLRREAVIDRFETTWQESGAARIEDFLPTPDTGDRDALLAELVKVDLEYRLRRRERPTAAEYLRRFPELAARAGEVEEWLREEESVHASRGRPPADELPRRLGRYELREPVGRGGFATVYRAWDPELGREVAIKVPRAEFVADPATSARLLREAAAAARLRHPGIVPVHEAGRDGELSYVVYEFIAGPTLAQVLKQSRPTPAQAAAWVADLARALDCAHKAGIVHRDIKPANVMMGPDGRPLLADFGLARQLTAVTLTQEGDVLGTPAYMAPEQAGGRSHSADARSDVYSLGVLLYELLAGRLPFEGNGAETLYRVVHEEPSPPSRHRSGVPGDLETICQKAMAKEPGRRYASAGALADDLQRFLEHRPIRARRVGPVGRVARWCRRKPALAATIGLALVTVATVAGLSLARVLEERDRYRVERDRAEANLYRALVSEAEAQLEARDMGWWWKAMDGLQQAAGLEVTARDPALLRDLAVQCMGSEYACFRPERDWPAHEGPVLAVAVSPDGRRLVTGGRDHAVRVWDAETGRLLAAFLGHGDRVTGVAFCPDGRHVVSASWDGGLRFWDADAPHEPPRVVQLAPEGVTALELSPDGSVVGAACRDGSVRLVPLDPTAAVRTLKAHSEEVTCLAFAPTSGLLATGAADRTLRVWDHAAGLQLLAWNVPNVPNAVTFHGEGDHLAWSDPETFGFQVRDLRTDQGVTHFQAHAGSVRAVVSAGWSLLAAGLDGTVRLWGGSGWRRQLAVARTGGSAVYAIAGGPQRGWVAAACGDGRIRRWQLAEPPERRLAMDNSHGVAFVGAGRRLVSHAWCLDLSAGLGGPATVYQPPAVRALVVHPRRAELAYATARGELVVWDTAAGRELRRWPGHDGPVTALALSPDGTRLASAGADGAAKVWDWDEERPLRSWDAGLGPLHGVAWAAGGRLAATGRRGVSVWDLERGGAPWPLSRRGQLYSALAAAGDRLAVAGPENTVELWDVVRRERRQVLRGHPGPVAALTFSADGRLLASAGDRTVRIWDPTAGHELTTFRMVNGPATWLAFSRDGSYVVSGGLPGMMPTFWDLRTRAAAAEVFDGGDPCGAFSADGTALLLGNEVGAVRRCPLAEIERLRSAAAGAAPAVRLIGPVRVDEPETIIPGGHRASVWGVAASPDGRWVATAAHDQTVKVWDGATLRLERTLTGHKSIAWSVAFSADGRLLASGADTIKVWDPAVGTERYQLDGHKRLVVSLAFHPHRPWLVSGSLDGTVRLWDVEKGQALGVFHAFEHVIHAVAISPDGRWLAAADDQHVVLWDLHGPSGATPRPPDRRLPGHRNPIRALAFSADGRYLASGSDQGVVFLWDGYTFERVVTLTGPSAQVRGLAFSRDGRFLAATGYAATTTLWDLDLVRARLREMGLNWR